MEVLESKDTVLKRYTNGTPEVKTTLEKIFGADIFITKITDRVRTYEDACKVLGVEPNLVVSDNSGVYQKDMLALKAYAQLILITRALNEGWTPDWNNSSQYKWSPYFDMRAGFGFSFSDFGLTRSVAVVGSRLCFKSRDLAEYAGKQFLSLYEKVMTL